jgi:predicted esterase
VGGVALAGNLLGDPAVRDVAVYLPPGYDRDEREWPMVVFLHAYGQRAASWVVPDQLRDGSLRPGLASRLDHEFATLGREGAVVVVADGWTSYGGGQWLASPVHGDFPGHVTDEVIPWVRSRFRVSGDRRRCGVVGYSSGAMGAWELATTRPELFSRAALLAMSARFEATSLLGALSYARKVGPDGPAGPQPGMLESWVAYGSAAAYSPNPDAPYFVDLPVDWRTGLIRDEVWQRWLAADPLRTAPHRRAALRALDQVLIEAGDADEYGGHFAGRAMASVLDELGANCDHREYHGRHSEQSVERVARAIAWAVPPAAEAPA